MFGRFERLVPLLHLLDCLDEIRGRFGNRCVTPSAASDPGVPEQFPRGYPEVRVLLEALHEEVSGGLSYGLAPR